MLDDADLRITGGDGIVPYRPEYARDATGDGLSDLVTTMYGGTSPVVWL